MNSDLQLKVQAYLDNELTPGEARQIASLLSTDPLARDLYQELKDTKAIVCQNEPVPALPESRDFYWSKIQREIARASQEPARSAPSSWWTRLLAPMAGAVALFAVLLSISGSRPTEGPVTLTSKPLQSAESTVSAAPSAPSHRGEVVAPGMSAITFRSEADGTTVVWISSKQQEPAAPAWVDWLE